MPSKKINQPMGMGSHQEMKDPTMMSTQQESQPTEALLYKQSEISMMGCKEKTQTKVSAMPSTGAISKTLMKTMKQRTAPPKTSSHKLVKPNLKTKDTEEKNTKFEHTVPLMGTCSAKLRPASVTKIPVKVCSQQKVMTKPSSSSSYLQVTREKRLSIPKNKSSNLLTTSVSRSTPHALSGVQQRSKLTKTSGVKSVITGSV